MRLSSVKKVLITGIEGFTGHYLAKELTEAGYVVCGTRFAERSEPTSDQTIYGCDLCDLKSIEEVLAQTTPDMVIHLAAISSVTHGDVDAIYRTNVVGTRNLLQALSQLNTTPERVLLVSSANIYGNSTGGIIDEDVTPAPANDYAVSKLAMELMSKLWTDRLPITIARPFNYTGVGQSTKFLLPKLVDHFKQSAKYIDLGNVEIVRDFSDVRTVVTCYRHLLERPASACKSGDVFNICSGAGYRLLDIMAMLETISGKHIEVHANAPGLSRANEVKSLIGSPARLAKAIGSISSIQLQETLTWMYHDAGY